MLNVEKKDLFSLVCRVFDFLATDTCEDVIVHQTMFEESSYNTPRKDNLYYVYGNGGTICNDSDIKFYTTLFRNDEDILETSMDIFSMWGGSLKKEVINHFNSESVVIYDRYDCENGDYNWIKEINSVEDFIQVLVYDYVIGDYYCWEDMEAEEKCAKLIENIWYGVEE